MRLGIMQPYFFPYIGYFQLMNAVDEFVVYDNIEFSKKGWINRNRILVNGKDDYITLPLKKDSDFLDIRDRYLAEGWTDERKKMLNRIIGSYRKAPYFTTVVPIIEQALLFDGVNLFDFILNSLRFIKNYLEIPASLVISSTLSIDHTLRSEDKVLEICRSRMAKTYINPIGGVSLYQKERFAGKGVELYFIKTTEFEYPQFNNTFIPHLSIVDVMLFNSKDRIKEYLNSCYTLT